MKSQRNLFATLSALILTATGMVFASPQAEAASSGPYKMEILVNQHKSREYRQRGTTYVMARPGREYAIRLTNPTGKRVAVALSVDGLNSIDAKHTTAYASKKWILDPYETVVIDGWQTSSSTLRKFYFTSEDASYGNWLGDTRNLGTISAAWFPEKQYRLESHYWGGEDRAERSFESKGKSRARKSPAASAKAGPSAAARSSAGSSAEVFQDAAPSASLAATGIGRERENQVYQVAFEHDSSPSRTITLRYEYRPQLIELGVIPQYRSTPMTRRETSRGFAPDPYQNGYRY